MCSCVVCGGIEAAGSAVWRAAKAEPAAIINSRQKEERQRRPEKNKPEKTLWKQTNRGETWLQKHFHPQEIMKTSKIKWNVAEKMAAPASTSCRLLILTINRDKLSIKAQLSHFTPYLFSSIRTKSHSAEDATWKHFTETINKSIKLHINFLFPAQWKPRISRVQFLKAFNPDQNYLDRIKSVDVIQFYPESRPDNVFGD